MLIVECITKLIGNALCVADFLVDISVAVAIDPIVYSRVGDIGAQLDCECTIQCAPIKIL